MNNESLREIPIVASATLVEPPSSNGLAQAFATRKRRKNHIPTPHPHFVALQPEEEAINRQAELFYLQKQIQLQTQMVFILEDGERIQGVIEWYDRHSIKVRGKSRLLLFKSAIKYLYKAGEIGAAPGK
jgi:sRNA-binding regulator protein Hfq